MKHNSSSGLSDFSDEFCSMDMVKRGIGIPIEISTEIIIYICYS